MKGSLTRRGYFLLVVLPLICLITIIAWAIYPRFVVGKEWADWTGFGESTKVISLNDPASPTVIYRPAKTLWDVLDLVVVPIALGIGAWFLNKAEKAREILAEESRANLDREIALDHQRDTALQSYLDKMTEIISREDFRKIYEKKRIDQIGAIAAARARTLTVIGVLDGKRKGSVLRFLSEARLLEKDHPKIRLEYADLSSSEANNLYLGDVYLREVNLSGATFHNVYLSRSLLAKANLSNANLESANFIAAELFAADFSHANLGFANLSNAHLEFCQLSDSNLKFSSFISAQLKHANLKRANLTNAKLSEANFIDADLERANLEDANLAEAILDRANLKGVNLRRANLESAKLTYADLEGADLRGANLNNTKLEWVNLKGVQMDSETQIEDKWRLVWRLVNKGTRGLQLANTDLSEAELSKLDLTDVDLSGANLSQSHLRYTILNNSNLSNADLRKANLNRAELSNAVLTDALLSESILIGANLTGALATDKQLKTASLDSATLPDGTYFREERKQSKSKKLSARDSRKKGTFKGNL